MLNLKLLVLSERVISHEKFHLVEWHFTELVNALIFTAFLLSSTSMALSCSIFPSILIIYIICTGHVIVEFMALSFGVGRWFDPGGGEIIDQ